jgi:hypothetical protein
MIDLSEEQHRQLESGQPIDVTDAQGTYVLLRKDVYDRLRASIDETVYTDAETLDRVMGEDDANDPFLTELQKKYGGKP